MGEFSDECKGEEDILVIKPKQNNMDVLKSNMEKPQVVPSINLLFEDFHLEVERNLELLGMIEVKLNTLQGYNEDTSLLSPGTKVENDRSSMVGELFTLVGRYRELNNRLGFCLRHLSSIV